MAFLQLCEVRSKRNRNNVLHKLVSNATARESFIHKFKTIDYIHHKLYKKMEFELCIAGLEKKSLFVKTMLQARCIVEIN